LNKVQTADAEVLSAVYVKSKAWDANQTSMSTEDLRKAFARKISLRMLLDVGQLRRTIQNGVANRVWIYYDAVEEFGYDHESPPPAWQIGENTLLYLPEEAQRLGIRIKGKWKLPEPPGDNKGRDEDFESCPVCGRPVTDCACGSPPVSGKPTQLSGFGTVAQAFQQVVDQCQEHHFSHLNRLTLTISGGGKQGAADLHAVGLAIPQFGRGRFTISQKLTSSFAGRSPAEGGSRETFEVTFKGGWERYKRIKALTDALAAEAEELSIQLQVMMEMEGGLDVNSVDFCTIRDVLATLDVGKIKLDVIPADDADGPARKG